VFNKQLSAQNKKKRREITEVEVAGREESSLRETGTQMQLKVSWWECGFCFCRPAKPWLPNAKNANECTLVFFVATP